MFDWLVAVLVALSGGATDMRLAPDVAPEVYEGGRQAVVLEYITPHCPTFEDEPCYVVVSRLPGEPMTVETGP